MSRRVLILQSNYIPWKGYFDLIADVDDFVVFDEVQYTRRDWRNRNKIKMPGGLSWLTIPVEVKDKFSQKISETRVADLSWAADHWRTISHAYARAPHFKRYKEQFEDLYRQAAELEYLSAVNCLFLESICEILGIDTRFHQSSDFTLAADKSEKLAGICADLEADVYLSGPAARDYLQYPPFESRGIAVEWFEYGPYAEYPQLYPPFEHAVSILDLLFMTGPEAPSFIGERRHG